ncbi:unnamed protein product [Amoebophrya sp. A25]|nr:unnamed protein product [Amoebophrya sp. A25]|eukprot:GSA25T00020115001.1
MPPCRCLNRRWKFWANDEVWSFASLWISLDVVRIICLSLFLVHACKHGIFMLILLVAVLSFLLDCTFPWWSKRGYLNDVDRSRRGLNFTLGVRFLLELLYATSWFARTLSGHSARAVCDPSVQPSTISSIFSGRGPNEEFTFDCSDGTSVDLKANNGMINFPPEDQVQCYMVQRGFIMWSALLFLATYSMLSLAFIVFSVIFLSENAYSITLQEDFAFKEQLVGTITREDIIAREAENQQSFHVLIDTAYSFLRMILGLYGIPQKNRDLVLRTIVGFFGVHNLTLGDVRIGRTLAQGKPFGGTLPTAHLTRGQPISRSEDFEEINFVLTFIGYAWLAYGYNEEEEPERPLAACCRVIGRWFGGGGKKIAQNVDAASRLAQQAGRLDVPGDDEEDEENVDDENTAEDSTRRSTASRVVDPASRRSSRASGTSWSSGSAPAPLEVEVPKPSPPPPGVRTNFATGRKGKTNTKRHNPNMKRDEEQDRKFERDMEKYLKLLQIRQTRMFRVQEQADRLKRQERAREKRQQRDLDNKTKTRLLEERERILQSEVSRLTNSGRLLSSTSAARSFGRSTGATLSTSSNRGWATSVAITPLQIYSLDDEEEVKNVSSSQANYTLGQPVDQHQTGKVWRGQRQAEGEALSDEENDNYYGQEPELYLDADEEPAQLDISSRPTRPASWISHADMGSQHQAPKLFSHRGEDYAPGPPLAPDPARPQRAPLVKQDSHLDEDDKIMRSRWQESIRERANIEAIKMRIANLESRLDFDPSDEEEVLEGPPLLQQQESNQLPEILKPEAEPPRNTLSTEKSSILQEENDTELEGVIDDTDLSESEREEIRHAIDEQEGDDAAKTLTRGDTTRQQSEDARATSEDISKQPAKTSASDFFDKNISETDAEREQSFRSAPFAYSSKRASSHRVSDGVGGARGPSGRTRRRTSSTSSRSAALSYPASSSLGSLALDDDLCIELLHVDTTPIGGERGVYFVVLDHFTRTLVLGFRGTVDINDWITNTSLAMEKIAPDADPDETIHSGMLACATSTLKELEEKLDFPDFLPEDYGIVCVGHSLGAGNSAAMGFLLARRYPELLMAKRLKCLLVAPPGTVCSLRLARESEKFMVSIVNDLDGVCRARPLMMVAFRNHYLQLLNDGKLSKHDISQLGDVMEAVEKKASAPDGAAAGRVVVNESDTAGRDAAGERGGPREEVDENYAHLQAGRRGRPEGSVSEPSRVPLAAPKAGSIPRDGRSSRRGSRSGDIEMSNPDAGQEGGNRGRSARELPPTRETAHQGARPLAQSPTNSSRKNDKGFKTVTRLKARLWDLWHRANMSGYHPMSSFNVLASRQFAAAALEERHRQYLNPSTPAPGGQELLSDGRQRSGTSGRGAGSGKTDERRAANCAPTSFPSSGSALSSSSTSNPFPAEACISMLTPSEVVDEIRSVLEPGDMVVVAVEQASVERVDAASFKLQRGMEGVVLNARGLKGCWLDFSEAVEEQAFLRGTHTQGLGPGTSPAQTTGTGSGGSLNPAERVEHRVYVSWEDLILHFHFVFFSMEKESALGLGNSHAGRSGRYNSRRGMQSTTKSGRMISAPETVVWAVRRIRAAAHARMSSRVSNSSSGGASRDILPITPAHATGKKLTKRQDSNLLLPPGGVDASITTGGRPDDRVLHAERRAISPFIERTTTGLRGPSSRRPVKASPSRGAEDGRLKYGQIFLDKLVERVHGSGYVAAGERGGPAKGEAKYDPARLSGATTGSWGTDSTTESILFHTALADPRATALGQDDAARISTNARAEPLLASFNRNNSRQQEEIEQFPSFTGGGNLVNAQLEEDSLTRPHLKERVVMEDPFLSGGNGDTWTPGKLLHVRRRRTPEENVALIRAAGNDFEPLLCRLIGTSGGQEVVAGTSAADPSQTQGDQVAQEGRGNSFGGGPLNASGGGDLSIPQQTNPMLTFVDTGDPELVQRRILREAAQARGIAPKPVTPFRATNTGAVTGTFATRQSSAIDRKVGGVVRRFAEGEAIEMIEASAIESRASSVDHDPILPSAPPAISPNKRAPPKRSTRNAPVALPLSSRAFSQQNRNANASDAVRFELPDAPILPVRKDSSQAQRRVRVKEPDPKETYLFYGEERTRPSDNESPEDRSNAGSTGSRGVSTGGPADGGTGSSPLRSSRRGLSGRRLRQERRNQLQEELRNARPRRPEASGKDENESNFGDEAQDDIAGADTTPSSRQQELRERTPYASSTPSSSVSKAGSPSRRSYNTSSTQRSRGQRASSDTMQRDTGDLFSLATDFSFIEHRPEDMYAYNPYKYDDDPRNREAFQHMDTYYHLNQAGTGRRRSNSMETERSQSSFGAFPTRDIQVDAPGRYTTSDTSRSYSPGRRPTRFASSTGPRITPSGRRTVATSSLRGYNLRRANADHNEEILAGFRAEQEQYDVLGGGGACNWLGRLFLGDDEHAVANFKDANEPDTCRLRVSDSKIARFMIDESWHLLNELTLDHRRAEEMERERNSREQMAALSTSIADRSASGGTRPGVGSSGGVMNFLYGRATATTAALFGLGVPVARDANQAFPLHDLLPNMRMGGEPLPEGSMRDFASRKIQMSSPGINRGEDYITRPATTVRVTTRMQAGAHAVDEAILAQLDRLGDQSRSAQVRASRRSMNAVNGGSMFTNMLEPHPEPRFLSVHENALGSVVSSAPALGPTSSSYSNAGEDGNPNPSSSRARGNSRLGSRQLLPSSSRGLSGGADIEMTEPGNYTSSRNRLAVPPITAAASKQERRPADDAEEDVFQIDGEGNVLSVTRRRTTSQLDLPVNLSSSAQFISQEETDAAVEPTPTMRMDRQTGRPSTATTVCENQYVKEEREWYGVWITRDELNFTHNAPEVFTDHGQHAYEESLRYIFRMFFAEQELQMLDEGRGPRHGGKSNVPKSVVQSPANEAVDFDVEHKHNMFYERILSPNADMTRFAEEIGADREQHQEQRGDQPKKEQTRATKPRRTQKADDNNGWSSSSSNTENEYHPHVFDFTRQGSHVADSGGASPSRRSDMEIDLPRVRKAAEDTRSLKARPKPEVSSHRRKTGHVYF